LPGKNLPSLATKADEISGLARISHTFLLRGGQVLAWLRQTAQFDPQCMDNTYPVKLIVFLARQGLTTARDEKCEKSRLGEYPPKFQGAKFQFLPLDSTADDYR
jgi:hypothetical protein